MSNAIIYDSTARAGRFAFDTGLGDSMPTACSLPDEDEVPEEFTDDFILLEMQCLTAEAFEDFLSVIRILARETWLGPSIDQLLAR